MSVQVYRYAVKGRPSDALLAEVRRAHILRNEITAIWRHADEKITALYAAAPDVTAAQDAADAARAEIGELREQIRVRKQAHRTRQPDPELVRRLTAAQERAAELAVSLRAARAAVREAERGELAAIRDGARAAVKALYPQAVKGILFADSPAPGALYWATFNLVASQQEAAMQRVIGLRAQHRPAELRFHRWDGCGTVAVQPQRAAGDPARTPEVLADPAGKWRNVVALSGAGRDMAVRLRFGGTGSEEWETLRLRMHRPLPAGGDVCMVQVTIRQVPNAFRGGDPYYKAAVAFTVKTPDDVTETAAGPVAAVHTGWRVLDDGSLRVAVIKGAAAPPPSLVFRDRRGHPVPVVRDHGSWQEVVIPAAVRDLDERTSGLRGVRAREMERARDAIRAHLAAHPEDGEVIDPAGSVEKWRSPARFGKAHDVVKDRLPGSPLLPALAHWRERELHLAPWEYGQRSRHVVGWRREMYRLIGVWVAGSAGRIVVDEWAATRRRPQDEEEDTRQMELARGNARLAAPGELRAAVKAAGVKRGVAVEEGPAGVSGVHRGCGGVLPADERAAGVVVTCRGCGRRVDQDVNAVSGMLANAEMEG